MVKIEILLREGKVSRIGELEKERYVNFFFHSYKDNLQHCRFIIQEFPRWSIICGYYAMHDITKLFLAKAYKIKIDVQVHSTTIKALRGLIDNKGIIKLLEAGHNEFIHMANDLAEAKRERTKTQYFTGSNYMKSEYRARAQKFLNNKVEPFIAKMDILLEAKR